MISISSGRSKTLLGKTRFARRRIPPKKTPKMREIKQNNSDESEDGDNQIADVVAFA